MSEHVEPEDGRRDAEAEQSLWAPLHDAFLMKVASDRLAGRLTLELEIAHLQEFEGLGAGVRWRLVMQDVTVLLARTWQKWPGPAPSTGGVTRDEESRLIHDFQARGRDVSADWEQFERAVAQDPLWIKDVAVVGRSGSQVLSGYGHGESSDAYYRFEVTGRALRCERSDVGEISLDSLLRSGQAYWDAFASRRPRANASKRSKNE